MTMQQFQQLSKAEQAAIINQYGVFVAERFVAGDRVYLYMVNYFYVELLHELSNLESKGVVISRIFDDARYLDVYAEIQNSALVF
jgi:hypothetical protein